MTSFTKDYTVVYEKPDGTIDRLFIVATSQAKAYETATEILAQKSAILRCYHNPTW